MIAEVVNFINPTRVLVEAPTAGTKSGAGCLPLFRAEYLDKKIRDVFAWREGAQIVLVGDVPESVKELAKMEK